MTQTEIQSVLAKHKLWLNDEEGGERADLSGADLSNADLKCADLRRADLRRADLSGADLSGADLKCADLKCADLRDTDLRHADLRHADLSNADLRHADLNGADIDYSCLPLWCGSLSAHFDDKHVVQIIYHAVKAGLNSKNTTEPVKNELKKLINLANQFHRVDECGRIEAEQNNKNQQR